MVNPQAFHCGPSGLPAVLGRMSPGGSSWRFQKGYPGMVQILAVFVASRGFARFVAHDLQDNYTTGYHLPPG